MVLQLSCEPTLSIVQMQHGLHNAAISSKANAGSLGVKRPGRPVPYPKCTSVHLSQNRRNVATEIYLTFDYNNQRDDFHQSSVKKIPASFFTGREIHVDVSFTNRERCRQSLKSVIFFAKRKRPLSFFRITSVIVSTEYCFLLAIILTQSNLTQVSVTQSNFAYLLTTWDANSNKRVSSASSKMGKRYMYLGRLRNLAPFSETPS